MAFSVIIDAQVCSQRDEVALHTDVASYAFKTNKLSHKEDTTLRAENFLSGSVMEVVDAAEPIGQFVWFMTSHRGSCVRAQPQQEVLSNILVF